MEIATRRHRRQARCNENHLASVDTIHLSSLMTSAAIDGILLTVANGGPSIHYPERPTALVHFIYLH